MEISTGVTLPDATLLMKDADGIHSVSLADKLKGRKVIIFAVPGAFTPTCSSAHVPSFIRTKDAFAAKGVDEIICISVNDPFVMDAWGKANNVGDKIIMLADPFLNFTKAIGTDVDKSARGLGIRSNRFTMLIDNMRAVNIQEESDTGMCEISAAENFLKII